MIDLPVDQLAFEDAQDEAGIIFGVFFCLYSTYYPI
jgi:hypothetical protein